jgi:hypothetical protein
VYQTRNSEQLTQDTLRNDASDIITHCFMGSFSETEEMNDNCGQTMLQEWWIEVSLYYILRLTF